jgi:cytochrome c oxidase subunit II
MKMTMNRRKLAAILLFAATGAIALSISSWQNKTPVLVRQANASEQPRVIEIRAREFKFLPSEITLKKGEPVILRLSSEDRTHGFFLRALKIDTDITPDKTTDIAVTPKYSGQYTVLCDHYCGAGHGRMKMKVTVIE